MQLFFRFSFSCIIILFLSQCAEQEANEQFTLLENGRTGLDFRNMLKEDENFNIFKYQYYYNGGGVAIADFNNDGLQDVFFTGNMVKNRLFVNKGNLEFNDITESSGVAVNEGWCTGANAVDINNDGWMDIYVCRAGYPFEKLRKNLLLINNGNLTFTNKAAEYGLDDDSYSTHSAFFDYDRDGDLDMFLLNHSSPEYSKGSLEIFKLKNKRQPELESKLFQNNNGKFVNVTESAGIKGNVLSLSLGLGVIDINNDGWTDIFIGNDFNESDYLFINNGDGTFTEKSKSTFDHTSMFSMGCDIADINNDGHMDLVSLDMLPESNYLQKLHSGADNYNKIAEMINQGFQPQFSKNVLQINNGNGSFSESAQMYGVSNTDWSWASLFMDFDNDTYQDLFISNGYLRDHTDMDFLQFTADQVIKADKGENPVSFEEYMASMPPINQPNYFFSNDKGEKFINKITEWKLTKPSVSGGSAYADLDNDGDLDIISTNVGDYAYVYRNNQKKNQNNYINIQLKGSTLNINGIGARVSLYSEGLKYVKDLQPCRGFQSTMEQKVFFGLGKKEKIDSIIINWPDGKFQKHITSEINTSIEISYKADGVFISNNSNVESIFSKDEGIPPFYFTADQFDDFKVQGLLVHFLTDRGPKSVTGDFNSDGLEDFVITGNKISNSKLYLQKQNGDFTSSDLPLKNVEISDIVCLKSDNNTMDLVVSVGSYKYQSEDNNKGIYILKNDGKGFFTTGQFIQTKDTNPSAIATIDFDKDGKEDIIVGGSCDNRMYPQSTSSCILQNKGNSRFEILDNSKINLGLINDIIVFDLDGDKNNEIIACGDWTPLMVLKIDKGLWTNVTEKYFTDSQKGFWKKLMIVNRDNTVQLIGGNLGLNSQLSASQSNPMQLFYEDYDQNGSLDPILAYHIIDGTYPFAPREDMIKQIPMLNKRFSSFGTFAKADIKTLLGETHFKKAKPLEVNTLETSFYILENGKFRKTMVDSKLQIAPVFAMYNLKTDDKSESNLIFAGNQSKVRVKLGRLNGNHGTMMVPKNESYEIVNSSLTGIDIRNDVRDLAYVKSKKGDVLVCSIYNGATIFYRKQNKK